MFSLSDGEIERFCSEDVPYGDLTTEALGLGNRPTQMRFTARGDMVVVGLEEAARIIARFGGTAQALEPCGQAVSAGTPLLVAHGPAEALLSAWKVAQVLVEAASGLATAARAMVEAAKAVNPAVVVACTRKSFPGTRTLSTKAILAGGATPHRLGLSETILIFPEHCALLGSLSLAEGIARVKAHSPEKTVTVEVGSLNEAREAARAGADVVQLEKFSVAQTAEVVALLHPLGIKVAPAGGLSANNAAAYAQAGADILVTSWPFSAPPRDVQVVITPDDDTP